MGATEIIEAATEAAQNISGTIDPAGLDPIYSALWNIQTLAVAQVAVTGLACGILLGLILWRWFK